MKKRKMIVLCIVSLILSFGISIFFTGDFHEVSDVVVNLKELRIGLTIHRACIMFCVFVFGGIHFIIPVNEIYNWLFDKRWLIGIVLSLLMTINAYHGVSIGYYNNVIQPEYKSEFSIPIFGMTRAVRSDEFVVSFPSILASSYGENAFGEYNDIMRGGDTLNIVSGVRLGFAMLGNAPQKLVYAILPVENAYSFCWSFQLIFGFLVTLELFYVISNNKKSLSTAGAFLVIFSSYNFWWGTVSQLLTAPATVICVYYFLQCKDKWKKILLGMSTAICFSMFVTNLYPAWQVPFGYMFLAIGVWVLHDNWNKVKKLRKSDWLIIGCSLVLALGLVISYLYAISEYTEAITQTAYPGKRIDNGSFYLSKLFYCAQAPFYAYRDIGNPSEAGVFFGLFPIPTVMAIYCWAKEKKKDWLTAGLLLAQFPMLLYVTVGFPESVAKILLFSNSTVYRMIDVIGLIQIFFIVIIFGKYEKTRKLPLILAVSAGMLVAVMNLYFSNRDYSGYMGLWKSILMFIVITGFSIGLMVDLKERLKNIWLISIICLSVFTGICVFPIMKGFDAVFSKPVASEIQKICKEEPEAKWLTSGGGIMLSGYNVACGAPTVNSVNTYPNLKLWEELDPNSEYRYMYNRYAHIDVAFTSNTTSFELIHADCMRMNLSYEDIEKTQAKYLLTMEEQEFEENPFVDFKKIYEENGMFIYHIMYE